MVIKRQNILECVEGSVLVHLSLGLSSNVLTRCAFMTSLLLQPLGAFVGLKIKLFYLPVVYLSCRGRTTISKDQNFFKVKIINW
jgi:hypothetical protein